MNTKQRTAMIFVLLLSLATSSCAPGQLFGPTVTPTPLPTLTPTATLAPTAVPTLTPTPALGKIYGKIFVDGTNTPIVTNIVLGEFVANAQALRLPSYLKVLTCLRVILAV